MSKNLLLILIFATTTAQAQVPDAPDPAKLIATAKATAEKLTTTSASWTVSIAISAEVTLRAEVLHTPAARRLSFTITQGNAASIELARIIETSTTWYVTQDKRFSKHRPFEAEFDLPVISLMHALADPRFLTADDARRLRQFTSRDGDLARYAVPPENPAAIRAMLAQYEEAVKGNPGLAADAKSQRTVNMLRSALEKGVPLTIDTRSGALAEYDTAKFTVKLANFQFIDSPPKLDQEIAREKWQDFTDDPTAAGKPEDLVMIGHCISWRPGQPGKDTEGLLLNLSTGKSRRIPFAGIAAIPGCFARNRSAVIISGMEVDQGTVHLYEIDLKTGINRRLGGDTLAVGQCLMPVLSPDGKTIATFYKNGQGKILDFQVALIDLDTGSAKLIGQLFDGAFINWLPDGKGFIVLKREYIDLKSPSEDVICKMDLNGTLTPICKGHSPLIVGNALLFEHPDGRKWHLCDLDGKNPHLLGDGLARHGFPAASPDGKQVLMMSFTNPATGPRPVIVDLATAKPEPINVPAGLWTMPAWR